MAPNDADYTGNYALFLDQVKKDFTEAEKFYRRALELDPNDATTTGNYASFLHVVKKDYAEAERLYRRALELAPNDAIANGNYAQFLAASRRFDAAAKLARRAWELLEDKTSDTAAKVALTRWLMDRVAQASGEPALSRLKSILKAGIERSPWSFDDMLAAAVPRLPEEERELARKLASAILDETQVAALETEPLWKTVEPVGLDVPWED